MSYGVAFEGGDCPACGCDLCGIPNADGSWTDGTELACNSCNFKAWVSCDDGGCWSNWEEPIIDERANR